VAAEYFRSGADKVSIGSDAVLIAEDYLRTGRMTGESAIESISRVYGSQAVVISVDPRRVYVADPQETAPPLSSRPPFRGPTGSATAGTSAPSRAAAKAATWTP
jgi:glutamine amidotransferase/cyclase